MKKLFFFFIVFVYALFFGFREVYAAADPVAYWKFDDGSGTAPVDSSGNNITGSFLSPNPTWSTDVPSDISFSDPYSLDFSNTHDGVTFSWPSGLNFDATAPRSFSFWYKPTGDGEADAGSFDRIISWDSDAFEIAGTFGSVSVHELAFYDGSWRDTGYALSVGTWYHITFTYDGTTAKFYVGNDLKYSAGSGGRALNGTMAIGTRQNGHNEGINGRIDDVRIYDYALDFNQISNLTAGSNNPDTPPATPTPTPSNTPTPAPTAASTNSSSNNSSKACVTVSKIPNFYEINPSKSSAMLYFTPVAEAESYTISYGLSSSANEYTVSFNHTDQSGAVSYLINSLDENTTYYFKIRGKNTCSTGNWSNSLSGKTKASLVSTIVQAFLPSKKIDVVTSKVTSNSNSPMPTSVPVPTQKTGITLDVKILDTQNKPLVDVAVTLHSQVQTARTDNNGIAHFTNVEKGEHKVMFSYNGYNGEQNLTVDGSKKDQALTVQVKLTNGLPWGLAAVIGVFVLIVFCYLLFLLMKKRKKEQGLSKRML